MLRYKLFVKTPLSAIRVAGILLRSGSYAQFRKQQDGNYLFWGTCPKPTDFKKLKKYCYRIIAYRHTNKIYKSEIIYETKYGKTRT